MAQNYNNHKKYYIPHHFIFLPMMLFFIVFGGYKAWKDDTLQIVWLVFSILSFCIFYLAIMLRQHYALGNQDRIIRLEFRLRYYELFRQSSREIEKQLSFSQLAALRFADDEEFKQLLQKAIKDNLSANSIKKSIRNWQADDMRV